MSPQFIAYIQELLDYNPESGLFRYKKRRNRSSSRVGDLAGYVNKDGYHCIKVTFHGRKINCSSARLAVAIVTGKDPGYRTISTKNGYRSDLRFKNLVVLDRSQRALRSAPGVNNTSGARGVQWIPSRGKWEASIKTPTTSHHLGYFERFEDAVLVRQRAVLQRMPPSIGGPLPGQ